MPMSGQRAFERVRLDGRLEYDLSSLSSHTLWDETQSCRADSPTLVHPSPRLPASKAAASRVGTSVA